MKVTAKLRHLRIAPRKVRLLADLIRDKEASEARNLLNFSLKKGSRPLKKLLESAIANARNNFQLAEENLRVFEIKVDEGPKLKRWRARARGRAAEIQKKTSHITLVLSGEEKKKEVNPPAGGAAGGAAGGPKETIIERKEIIKEKPKLKAKVPKPKKEIASLRSWVSGKKFFRRKAM